MSKYELARHSFFLSVVFTLLNWVIVDNLVVAIKFWQYLLIEAIILVSFKLYQFTLHKIQRQ
jgi:hypothetical protein